MQGKKGVFSLPIKVLHEGEMVDVGLGEAIKNVTLDDTLTVKYVITTFRYNLKNGQFFLYSRSIIFFFSLLVIS